MAALCHGGGVLVRQGEDGRAEKLRQGEDKLVGFLIWAVEERRSGSACGRRAAALMDPLDGGGGCRERGKDWPAIYRPN